MRYEQRPWLTTTPWSQAVDPTGHVWTVQPHWPSWQRRITCRCGHGPLVWAPSPTDMTYVLVPEVPDAMSALVATFGVPEVLAWRDEGAAWWRCAPPTAETVYRHLRDFHGTLTQGSPSARLGYPGGHAEALAYHWQLHQQQLVFPMPEPHTH